MDKFSDRQLEVLIETMNTAIAIRVRDHAADDDCPIVKRNRDEYVPPATIYQACLKSLKPCRKIIETEERFNIRNKLDETLDIRRS